METPRDDEGYEIVFDEKYFVKEPSPIDELLEWQKQNQRKKIKTLEEHFEGRPKIRDENLESIIEKQSELIRELEIAQHFDPYNHDRHQKIRKEINDLTVQIGNEKTGCWKDMALLLTALLDALRDYQALMGMEKIH